MFGSKNGNNSLNDLLQNFDLKNWAAPRIEDLNSIPKGDMPGDKVEISESHLEKANKIFPDLIQKAKKHCMDNSADKLVISVHGGSGVGKSEIASVLAYYFNNSNIKSYVMSGDNYPHRIPMYNDAERYRIFRESGLKAVKDSGKLNDEVMQIIEELKVNDSDADPKYVEKYPWLGAYQASGSEALAGYLGTKNEIDFEKVSNIISKFKNGESPINLKRMGRKEDELWEDPIDFSEVKVLIIEWTHGNNDNLIGVDIPILLNSTPKETLEHRMKRNRDGGADSPFTTMVLKIEQNLLHSQSHKAKIIVTKSGTVVTHEEYLKLMNN
jgi:alpha-galactosidase